MTPQSVTYSANGSCATFGFDFPVFEPADLEVLLNGTVQTSGFTLLGASSPEGGAVRFTSAPASGAAVTLRRAGKVQVSGSDAPGFLEDKIAAGSHIVVTKTSDSTGEHLSIATDIDPAAFATAAQGAKADSALQASAIGVSIQAQDDDLDWLAANLTSAGKALLDDADAAAQRATLGLGGAATRDVDTDGTLAANSDTLLPSEKAVKTYVDGKIADIVSSSEFVSLEQNLAQTYLLSAAVGGWGAGLLAHGAYDAFNSDTIGANSTGATYYGPSRHYTNDFAGYGANLCTAAQQINGGTNSDYGTSAAFDGVFNPASWNTGTQWASSQAGSSVNGAAYLGQDFGAGVTRDIRQVRISILDNCQVTSIRVQHSDDCSTWSDATIASVVDNFSTNAIQFASAGSHRYWRVIANSSPGNGSAWGIGELQMMEPSSPLDMTLVSNALSPAPAGAPAMVKLMVLWKQVDAAVLNTDITAEASRDGSTWTGGTLADTGYTANGYKMLWAAIDVSGQPSGTTVKVRLKTLNNKVQQIKGVTLLAT